MLHGNKESKDHVLYVFVHLFQMWNKLQCQSWNLRTKTVFLLSCYQIKKLLGCLCSEIMLSFNKFKMQCQYLKHISDKYTDRIIHDLKVTVKSQDLHNTSKNKWDSNWPKLTSPMWLEDSIILSLFFIRSRWVCTRYSQL